MDVTEQVIERERLLKSALEELGRSEDRLRQILDTVPVLVWRNRPDGATEFVNQQYLDYTGLPEMRALDGGLFKAVHPDDAAGLSQALRATWTTGIAGQAEARLRRFDGEYRWFMLRTQPLLDEAGKIVDWCGVATDIDDRKRAEAALRESRQQFRDYAETASDWLWESGPDHRFADLSLHSKPAAVLASGPIGKLRWEIASDVESEPEKWQQHQAALDARIPFRDLVYRTIDRFGSPLYLRTSGRPFYDAKGHFLGYRGVATDITAAIRADQAEQALRKAQLELAHVSRVTTLGELTASISHEVNQPLAGIMANAGACLRWLDRDSPEIGEARRSVEGIIADSNRATEVIQRIRALAKKAEVDMVPLDLNEVVSEVVALVQRELVSHGVSLQMELDPNLPMTMGDRIQLQQVIINLATNGIDAMDDVTDRPRELVIKSGQEEHRVFVTVSDCGVGFSDENADLIFNPFFTTKASGMGMGLSICRSILEAHRGRLSAFRNRGPGATFKFVMPSSSEEPS
jgi:PAS domain S-box-containing protein